MGTAIFPTLPGLTFPVTRSPIWDTLTQATVSGKETRIALQTYPRWKWQLVVSILRSSAAYTEFQTLIGFLNARQGMFDSFLYSDADDYSTLVNLAGTAQTLGVSDGAKKAYQLTRAFGSFVEPVLAPNAVATVYDNGTPIAAIGVPTSGALTQTTAGALAATTYYVCSTWVTATGETIASAETNLAVLINKVLNVAAPGSAPAAATGWNVYVSNTAGGGSGHEQLQNATPNALGAAWVEPNAGLIAGAAYPAVDKLSAWNVQNWGTTTPGIVNLAVALTTGHTLSADFTYYWPCRFSADTYDFNLFMNQMYEVKKIEFESVKN